MLINQRECFLGIASKEKRGRAIMVITFPLVGHAFSMLGR